MGHCLTWGEGSWFNPPLLWQELSLKGIQLRSKPRMQDLPSPQKWRGWWWGSCSCCFFIADVPFPPPPQSPPPHLPHLHPSPLPVSWVLEGRSDAPANEFRTSFEWLWYRMRLSNKLHFLLSLLLAFIYLSTLYSTVPFESSYMYVSAGICMEQ
jgi:hypothetical protein